MDKIYINSIYKSSKSNETSNKKNALQYLHLFTISQK